MSSIFQESSDNPGIFRTWGIFRTLPSIYDVTFFEWTMAYIWWSILLRTLYKYDIYRLLMHSKLYHIQNSTHLKYCESLKYSLNKALCNLDIFTTNAYSSPSKLRTRGIWWAVFYRTLCDTGIFRTRGIFQTLSNIYDGEFFQNHV